MDINTNYQKCKSTDFVKQMEEVCPKQLGNYHATPDVLSTTSLLAAVILNSSNNTCWDKDSWDKSIWDRSF